MSETTQTTEQAPEAKSERTGFHCKCKECREARGWYASTFFLAGGIVGAAISALITFNVVSSRAEERLHAEQDNAGGYSAPPLPFPMTGKPSRPAIEG